MGASELTLSFWFGTVVLQLLGDKEVGGFWIQLGLNLPYGKPERHAPYNLKYGLSAAKPRLSIAATRSHREGARSALKRWRVGAKMA